MQLLSPENVLAQKGKNEGEAKERIRRLRDEEAAANLALSRVKAKVAADTESIGRDFAAFEEETTRRTKELSNEVVSLEQRRNEALKPIDEERERMDRRIKEAEAFEDELEQDLIRLQEGKQLLVDRTIKLNAREDDIEGIENDLRNREERVIAAEMRLKESSVELAEKWAEYHKAVHDANANLVQREKLVEHDKLVTKQFKYTLDEKAKELDQRKLALQDGYESLQRAREEILGRKE